MPIQIAIADGDVAGFTNSARERLRQATNEYAAGIIKEAYRIEAARNSGSAPPEITNGMVHDAVLLDRQGLGARQSNLPSKVLRVISAVLTLVVGLMYNVADLQNKTYLASFIILIAVAILTMTISIVRE